jgi:hypothetical protein
MTTRIQREPNEHVSTLICHGSARVVAHSVNLQAPAPGPAPSRAIAQLAN